MSTTPRRVGAIDLGTNTAMLLVLEERDDGVLHPLVDVELYPRLGDGLERTGHLDPAARARTLAAVQRLVTTASEYAPHTLSLVGTSALREGDRDGRFLAELRSLVPSARVIDGPEEARMTTAGALAVAETHGDFVCIDVGGGSTEVVVGTSNGPRAPFVLQETVSLRLGSVRLHGRHGAGDEPYLDAYGDARSQLFQALPVLRAEHRSVLAVAGSAATVGALALQERGEPWREGATVPTDEVDATVERLVLTDEEDRAALHPWLAQRADVAPYGAIVLQAALHHLDAREVVVSTAGVRWGLALELLAAR